MNLTDVLNISTIEVKLAVKNRDQLFQNIARLAGTHPAMNGVSPEIVVKALHQREELACTALGNGVAVPHCRLSSISEFIVGFVTTEKAIDYNSIDHEKVSIFPFVIAPEEKPKDHLKILSALSKLLRNQKTRTAIRASKSAEELFLILNDILADAASAVPKPLTGGMKMLHVFVNREDNFNDILNVFASSDPVGAMVLEAHESTEYLSRLPVFASFWSNDMNIFNRIIVAVVKEALLNQTLRSIEYVCGDLHNQTDVMVTVTDLHHTFGSLEP
jgi:mannitol/fructose-specific phosphotransferase system IIA component (Ntr-type)